MRVERWRRTTHTRYAALECWLRPDLGRVRPTYQCVPSQRAPGVTAGSGVAPPPSPAAAPGELGAEGVLHEGRCRAAAGGVRSAPLPAAAARARSTRCRWLRACSARSEAAGRRSARPAQPGAALRSDPRASRALGYG